MMWHADGVIRERLFGCAWMGLVVVFVVLAFGPGVARAEYGVSEFGAVFSSLQAGGHPDFTTKIVFRLSGEEHPEGDPRDIAVDLPAGLSGNPEAVGSCEMRLVEAEACPSGTAVGEAKVELQFEPNGAPVPVTTDVYNVPPYHDEPAAFAFVADGLPVRLDASLRDEPGLPGRYALRVLASELSEAEVILSSTLTFWGVPAEHNGAAGAVAPRAFMTNPSTCEGEATSGGPLVFGLRTDSWQHPAADVLALPAVSALSTLEGGGGAVGVSGCSALVFAPSLSVTPEAGAAGEPSGYSIDLKVPQNENPASVATPDLREASVTLPAGTVVSPAAAMGLEGCQDTQAPEPGNNQVGLDTEAPASCSPASKVGKVVVTTPLLASPLEGSVYLARQEANPFGSLIALYIVAEGDGVSVKIPGEVKLNQETGQITTVFPNNPQVPFSELKLDLHGGPRAAVANPSTCGLAETTGLLTPYGSGEPGVPASVSSAFEVSGCVASGFAPSFFAQSTEPQASGYSPLTLAFSRSDGEQDFSAISVTTPAGLLGFLSRIPLCGEPQAAEGTCPEASKIGHVQVAAGPGSEPVVIPQAGEPQDPVYLTGPYNGGPFGLSIVVPAKAGPFDLGTPVGKPIVIQASISVDPHTSQLTAKTGKALPTILKGIPLQVRTVLVTLDHKEFIFNPTNCNTQSITGSITSAQNTTATVSAPFTAVNCASVPFSPEFVVGSASKTSREDGASLDVKVATPFGQAHLHQVKVDLPKQLPSRLKTIQKACAEATFNSNPEACPKGSLVGTATAITPILNDPLTGPAYLVSHGGAAFPNIVIILKGQGVTFDLEGSIFISKTGITSTTFATIPDAPISSFELKLPQGPESALAANGNLCAQALLMPTFLEGQNGAQIKRETTITVAGCKPVASIAKHKITGHNLILSVKSYPAGTITITGTGLRRYHKTLAAGTHTIKVALSNTGINDLRHHRKIKVKISLKNTTATTNITLKQTL
jgi:hypothetical protein